MQFIRYLFVQVLAYGLDMGGFIFMFTRLGLDPLIANLASKVLAGLFAFVAHRAFTFGATEVRAGQQAVRYFALLALNIPLSAAVLTAILWVVTDPVVSKFFSDVICVAITYWLTKRYVFLHGGLVERTNSEGRIRK